MDQKINLEISYQTIFKIILALAVIIFLFLVRNIVLALFAAFVISTITNPLVDWTEKRKFPRTVAASLIYLAILAFLVLFFYAIIPSLIGEIRNLILHFPQYIEENMDSYPFLEQYNLKENIDKAVLAAANFIKSEAVDIFISTVSALSSLFYLFFTLAVSFYLAVERNFVKQYLKKLIGASNHENLIKILDEIEFKMGRWFMGQLALSAITGAAIFIGLTLLGIPFAFFLAILAAILRFIPYLGGLVSDGIGILIAFLISPILGAVTFLMYYTIQQIEAYIIIPIVMRKTVGLNPIIVITAVVAGGQLAGIVGALLAIPIAIVLVILVKRLVLKENENIIAK